MRTGSAFLALALAAGVAAGGCVPIATDSYCKSCTANSQCGGTDNFCIGTGSSGFCGVDCSLGQDCPANSRCVTVTVGGVNEGQNCVPNEGMACVAGAGGAGGSDAGGAGGGNDAGGGNVGPVNCTSPYVTNITNPANTDYQLTIDGSGFGATKGQVLFGATPATVINSWTDTQIKLWVPSAAIPTATTTLTVTVQTATGTSCGYAGVQIVPGTCVSAGTRVALAGGKDKPIEDILAGDKILAIDPDTRRVREAVVNKLLVHQGKGFSLSTLRLSRGQKLQVTANHPVLTGKKWVAVEELRPGDVVYTLDPVKKKALKSTIVSIVRDESKADVVYNLSTSAHNYFANDLLIHNKCLGRGSLVDTPAGKVPVDQVKVGQLVFGEENGQRVATRVTHLYAKSTVLPAIPGKRLTASVSATVNHRVRVGASFVAAGSIGQPDQAIPGTVYDLKTEAGNYFADGWLLEAGE